MNIECCKGVMYSLLLLLMTLGNAHAAMVSFTLTGQVIDTGSNPFGLVSGNTITAIGTFDDSALVSGTGTVLFDSGSGNSLTIFVGTETFTAANDQDYIAGGYPKFILSSYILTSFDFFAEAGIEGAPADFSSYGVYFDDLDAFFGQWDANIELNAVPVPAAVWLFGSGLLGLVGVARRGKSA